MNNQFINSNVMYYNNFYGGNFNYGMNYFGNSYNYVYSYNNAYNYGFGNMQYMQMQQMIIKMQQLMMQMQTMQMIQQMGVQSCRMNGVGAMQQIPSFPKFESNKNIAPAVKENKVTKSNSDKAKESKPSEKSQGILGKISGEAGTAIGKGIGTVIGGAIGGPIGGLVGNLAGGVIGKVASGVIEKVGGKVVDGAKSVFKKIGSFFGF